MNVTRCATRTRRAILLSVVLSVVPHEADCDSIGRYENRDFRYSFRIPLGLQFLTDAPPAPNHGCRIALGSDRDVWGDASYNVLERSSAAEVLQDLLRPLLVTGAQMRVLDRGPALLAGLNAERLILQYRHDDTAAPVIL